MKILAIFILLLSVNCAFSFLSFIKNKFFTKSETEKLNKKCYYFDRFCLLRQEECLRECQSQQTTGKKRKLKKELSKLFTLPGLAFCSTFGQSFGTYLENLAEENVSDGQKASDLRLFLTKSSEGLSLAIGGICGSDVAEVVGCQKCGIKTDFEDILKTQNITMAKLFAAEHKIAKIKKAMHDVNTEMMKNHELKDTPLKKLLQYEPVLEQTEQILYWFSQREKSSVFKNIFQQKLLGLQGKLVFLSYI